MQASRFMSCHRHAGLSLTSASAIAAIAAIAVTPPVMSAQEAQLQSAPVQAPVYYTTAYHLAQLRASSLESSTDQITVFFPAGLEARALTDRARVQGMLRFYGDSLGVTLNVTLGLVDRATWSTMHLVQSYGIPGVAGEPAVAFVPATDDGPITTDALSIEARVGDVARGLLTQAGTDWAGAAGSYASLVGLHELGHAIAYEYGIHPKSQWLQDWVAMYVAYAYMHAERPDDARVWEGVLQGFRDAVQPEHRTLAEFDRLYSAGGTLTHTWYQARLQEQVKAVHAVHGVDVLRKMRVAFPLETPRASGDEVIARMDAIAPGFRAWAQTMR